LYQLDEFFETQDPSIMVLQQILDWLWDASISKDLIDVDPFSTENIMEARRDSVGIISLFDEENQKRSKQWLLIF